MILSEEGPPHYEEQWLSLHQIFWELAMDHPQQQQKKQIKLYIADLLIIILTTNTKYIYRQIVMSLSLSLRLSLSLSLSLSLFLCIYHILLLARRLPARKCN